MTNVQEKVFVFSYHGSENIIQTPDLKAGKKHNDYGQGFYCTQDLELAKKSGVSLRSIQMYEQRKNDIDKAQVHTLYKLDATLSCGIGDLLERPHKEL